MRLASTPTDAVRGAAVVAVLNDESVYRALDWRRIAGLAARGAKVYACSPEIVREASNQMGTSILGSKS